MASTATTAPTSGGATNGKRGTKRSVDEVVANGSSSTNGASAGGGAGGGAGAGASASDSYSKIIDVSDVAAGSVKLPSYSWPSTYKEDEKHYLDVLRGYLQCRTVSSELTYDSAVKLIVSEGKRLGLETEVFELHPKSPIVLQKWQGSDPSLPCLVLNSHMDVVPVEADKWVCDPFSADVIDGKIYGRGIQDMKIVGIWYLGAVARLMRMGYKPKRTIYLLWVPDEELSGVRGMRKFVEDKRRVDMNIGLVLDEGLATPADEVTVFWGERKIWWVRVRTTGNVGHGSRFIEATAVEKLMKVANSILAFRAEQHKELKDGHQCGKALGDVTTVNLTSLHAGYHSTAYNVVPGTAEAGFDFRIPVTTDLDKFRKQLEQWCEGDGVKFELIHGTDFGWNTHAQNPPTEDNEWWQAFTAGCAAAKVAIKPEVFPAATDSRFLRMAGIPAIGFSPMPNTPTLLHDHNEHVSSDTFVTGIGSYVELIRHLSTTVLASEKAAQAAQTKKQKV